MSEEQPVYIDRERMERALAGPSYMVPQGLTREQFRAFMDVVSQVQRDATAAERERILSELDGFRCNEKAVNMSGHDFIRDELLDDIDAAIRAGAEGERG